MKKYFGIIGNPIKHSLSPILHKYWFDKYNIDADYVTMEAKDNDLPKKIDFCSVKLKYKFKKSILPVYSIYTIHLDNNFSIIQWTAEPRQ